MSGATTAGIPWLRALVGEAAWAIAHTKDNYLAAFYHRIARRRAKQKASMALMHKVLVIIYHVLRTKKPYAEGVSESGFYAWQHRAPGQLQQQDQRLGQQIAQAYEAGRRVYGSPRVHAELQAQGIHVSRKRVARLMRLQGLAARRIRRKPLTTDSPHANPVAPNRLQRDSHATRPNQTWLTDITSVPTSEGWLYLAAVLDGYACRLLGWAMSPQRDARLVEAALSMALAQRHPAKGLLHHSDRGSQYTSISYQVLLQAHGIQVSMSRALDRYDNAMMPSFFGTLKAECVDRQRFATHGQARSVLCEYLEVFYNRQRWHSSLGYVSPEVYEQRVPPS